jgi:FMN phosphatase YigB (HAD superfamily)
MVLKGVIFDLDGVLVDTSRRTNGGGRSWRKGYAFDEDVYHQKVDGRPRFDGARAVMVDATPSCPRRA